ncbi:hypothetical protein [Xenorhabdus kozodoii]|uniref:Uncharacterized protein n=1 Tax=Xenorhabdus kozodoii TaxID=351676 RepID=A0A2D0LDE1_9GAMM|nr:hypothetical protein [Xenorhabdus kozodoii]PHM73670.1 hypothetical protein Xkoz_01491 [Xenorhabdus kozodoii]
MKNIKLIPHGVFNLFVLMLLSTISTSVFSSAEHPITINNQTNYTITVYSPPSYGRCTYKPREGEPDFITVAPGQKGVFIWEDKDGFGPCFFEEKFTSFKFITQDNKLLWTGRIGMIEQKDGYIDPPYFYGLFYSKQYCPARLEELTPTSDGAPPPFFIQASFNSTPIPIGPLYDMYNYRAETMHESNSGWAITLTQPPEGTYLHDAGDPEYWTCYD